MPTFGVAFRQPRGAGGSRIVGSCNSCRVTPRVLSNGTDNGSISPTSPLARIRTLPSTPRSASGALYHQQHHLRLLIPPQARRPSSLSSASAEEAATSAGMSHGVLPLLNLCEALELDAATGKRMVEQHPALLKKCPAALRRKCEYIVDRTGSSWAAVLALAQQQPGLLLRSPSAAVARLQAIASVLEVALPDVAAMVAGHPVLMSSVEVGQLAGLAPRVLREVQEAAQEAAGQ